MKTAMLVEDRDNAYLFLDPTNAPPEASPVEFTLAPGIRFDQIENDDEVVWLSDDKTIRVVPRETVDFEKDPFDKEWPIPIAVICMTKDDYETALGA